MTNWYTEQVKTITRRHFLSNCQVGLGGIAFASLLGTGRSSASIKREAVGPMMPKQPHFAPKAKRVIYLHMAGSPSQIDLFDYKPELVKRNQQKCPESFLEKQRFAFIKGHPTLLGTPHKFSQRGVNGRWVSDLLPHLGGIIDELTMVHSMTTDQFNHAPAQLFVHTGQMRSGFPSLGSWVTYGLGSENQNLPGFVVLVSGGKMPSAGKRLWGAGFLPSVYQGVQCRNTGDPILYVTNPKGMNRGIRRKSLDTLAELNHMQASKMGDPETLARIEQFELAYRMQTSVPEVMDITRESKETLTAYGAEPGKPLFANNCLLARRLVEQGVRFVQLYDWGWDEHGTTKGDDLLHQLPKKCRETDKPVAALITDLKQRGLLEETLVIWGGEFGRTSMNEARDGSKFLGRDHHPHAFTMFFAGGGMKPGVVHGATDELGYFVTEDKMTVLDLQSTILNQLGFDAKRLSYPFQGLNARLIGPTGEGEVRRTLLS